MRKLVKILSGFLLKFFLATLGFWTQGLTLVRQVLDHLSHSNSPKNII
jgi:hypothetical protein